MTSAGGQFEKEVNIIENPYIDTLNVTLPDIYEWEETEEFGLAGYDQDENELDLYDYLQAGEFKDGKLKFIDKQNLTESQTVIDAGGNGTWRVQKFADTKTYKVTFVPNGNVKAKGIITFVVTTASFNTDTKMATVGARGTSGNISPELKKAATVGVDFNQALQFLDANGKLMDRAHNEKYPKFVQTNGTKVTASLAKTDTVNLTDEKIAEANHTDSIPDFNFYYVVSAKDKDTSVKDQESVIQGEGATDGIAPTEGQYYVFLIASQDLDTPSKTRIIDSRSFYVSNGQVGDVPVSYTAKVNNKLYTGKKYDDNVAVTVDVTYRNGVVVKGLNASGVALDSGFKVDEVAKNKISKGTIEGDGSTTVNVYLAEVAGLDEDGKPKTYTNDGAVATCTLTYSDDDPVGTKVTFKRNVELSNYGTSWPEDETETVWDINGDSAIIVNGGKLTMYNGNVAGDTYTMQVEDQYGTAMTDAKYYINGEQVPKEGKEFADGKAVKVLEIKGQSKGSEVSQTWRINVPKDVEVWARDISTTTESETVSTPAELRAILKDAANETDITKTYEITVAGDIEKTGDIVIPLNTTLKVNKAVQLDTGANKVTIYGKLVVNGEWEVAKGAVIENSGLVTGSGDVTLDGAKLTSAEDVGEGVWNVGGDTLHLNGCTIEAGYFGGHIEVTKDTTISNPITLVAGATINFAKAGKVTGMENISVDNTMLGDEKVTITDQAGTKIVVGETEMEVTKAGEAATTVDISAYDDGAPLPIVSGSGDVAKKVETYSISYKVGEADYTDSDLSTMYIDESGKADVKTIVAGLVNDELGNEFKVVDETKDVKVNDNNTIVVTLTETTSDDLTTYSISYKYATGVAKPDTTGLSTSYVDKTKAEGETLKKAIADQVNKEIGTKYAVVTAANVTIEDKKATVTLTDVDNTQKTAAVANAEKALKKLSDALAAYETADEEDADEAFAALKEALTDAEKAVEDYSAKYTDAEELDGYENIAEAQAIVDDAAKDADAAAAEEALGELDTALTDYNSAEDKSTKLEALETAYGEAKKAVEDYAAEYNDAEDLEGYEALAKAAKAIAKADIDALKFTGLKLGENTTDSTVLNDAIVELAEEVVKDNDATVTVSNIVTEKDGKDQLTVAGGIITATVTVAKDGYSKDFKNVEITNPEVEGYATAKATANEKIAAVRTQVTAYNAQDADATAKANAVTALGTETSGAIKDAEAAVKAYTDLGGKTADLTDYGQIAEAKTIVKNAEDAKTAANEKIAAANTKYTTLNTTKSTANWTAWTTAKSAADTAIASYKDTTGDTTGTKLTSYDTYQTNAASAATIGSKTIKAINSEFKAEAKVPKDTVEDTAKAQLPAAVSGTALDGTAVTNVPLTWTITNYDGATEADYNASAAVGGGYELANGVTITGKVTVAMTADQAIAADVALITAIAGDGKTSVVLPAAENGSTITYTIKTPGTKVVDAQDSPYAENATVSGTLKIANGTSTSCTATVITATISKADGTTVTKEITVSDDTDASKAKIAVADPA